MKSSITIDSIEKKKSKYLVTTNDGVYDFDEDTIIKYYVFKDKVFSKAEFSLILESVDINKAMNKVINYLSFKSRTIHEINVYLKDFVSKDIVIEKLIKLGYLNDDTYAKSYLDYCIRNKKGPLFFENKLISKGVDKKYIIKYKDLFTDQIQLDIITNITTAFTLKNNTKPIIKIKTTLINKLLRDGFDKDNIYSVINKYEFIDNSYDSLIKDYEKKLLQLSSRDLTDKEIKQKMITYLINKGYDYSKIKDLF